MEEASEQNKNGHNISTERNGGELAALTTELTQVRLLQEKDEVWVLLSPPRAHSQDCDESPSS